jgi:hypothetical protein
VLFVLSIICVSGCSRNLDVSGTVVFEDGSPLEVGTVAFTDGVQQSRSNIGRGGKFTLGMLSDKDGIKPGTYKVYISGAESVKEEKTTTKSSDSSTGEEVDVVVTKRFYTPLVDPKFTTPDETPLSFEIDKNTKLEIIIEKAKGDDALPRER